MGNPALKFLGCWFFGRLSIKLLELPLSIGVTVPLEALRLLLLPPVLK